MGNQIIKQSDGKFAIFSSFTETIIVWDATEDEVVEWFADQAAESARRDARRLIEHVAAGEQRRAYAQRALPWEEALVKDREHGGDVWQSFDDPERMPK